MRTAPRACTSQCRTRSRRRPRRSSSPIRCASSAISCGSAPAARRAQRRRRRRARAARARGLPALARRRAPPRTRRTGAGEASRAPGRDLLNGEELPGEGDALTHRRRPRACRDAGRRGLRTVSQRANRQARRIGVGPLSDVSLSSTDAFHTCAPATPTVGRSRRGGGGRWSEERTRDDEPGWRR